MAGRNSPAAAHAGRIRIELHLAELYRLDMAEAAFEVVCKLWPDTDTTIRQRARIVR